MSLFRLGIVVCSFLMFGCVPAPQEASDPPSRAALDPEAIALVPEWVEPNLFVPARSARLPTYRWGEVIFHAKQGDCTHVVDPAGASDCATRRTRVVMAKNRVFKQEFDFKLGQRYLISFDFHITPDQLPKGTRFSMARFYGSRHPVNPLFDVQVDAKRGVTFHGTQCVSPEDMGGWHRFSIRMRLANDNTGFLEMRCDRPLRVGLPLLAKSEVNTARPFDCVLGRRCRRGPVPHQFSVEMGIIADPVAGRFAPMPAEGLTVRMKRVIAKRLFVIIGRVEDY